MLYYIKSNYIAVYQVLLYHIIFYCRSHYFLL